MSTVSGATSGTTWPADVIHVNEDGWVLINRGREQGVTPGLRLLVVGQGIRDLHDLYAADEASGGPPVLRIRRTYEQLEVIHTEPQCCIAIAARVPTERRPTIYQGPEGELLVWAPLPPDFTWPRPGEDTELPADERWQGDAVTADAPGDETTTSETTTSHVSSTDTPPEHGEQDDERWEHALPLNGVNVGDIVLPAVHVSPGMQAGDVTQAAGGANPSNPFESGRSYDWMKPAR